MLTSRLDPGFCCGSGSKPDVQPTYFEGAIMGQSCSRRTLRGGSSVTTTMFSASERIRNVLLAIYGRTRLSLCCDPCLPVSSLQMNLGRIQAFDPSPSILYSLETPTQCVKVIIFIFHQPFLGYWPRCYCPPRALLPHPRPTLPIYKPSP